MKLRIAVAVVVLGAGCRGEVVRDVAGDFSFVRWPDEGVVLVGSDSGLVLVDPDALTAERVTTEPVLAAATDADGRLLFSETYVAFPESSDVICIANCAVDVVRTDASGGGREVLVEDVIANLADTFVQSPDRTALAYQTAERGLGLLDYASGDEVSAPLQTWVMSVSDDASEAVYLQSSIPGDEPWQHFLRFDAASGQSAPIALEDDPDTVWTWRFYQGDHHALIDTDGGTTIAMAALSTGAREWTLTFDEPVNASTISWSIDGLWLSFYTTDNRLHVIDVTAGEEVGAVRRRLGNDVWSGPSAASPFGDRVASIVDGHVYIDPF
jgi:hypothetical protein